MQQTTSRIYLSPAALVSTYRAATNTCIILSMCLFMPMCVLTAQSRLLITSRSVRGVLGIGTAPSAFQSSRISLVSATDTTLADSLARQLATITTDTGAFAPGHRDFTRYDTPGFCRAAAITARGTFRRSLEGQLLSDTLAMDTVGLGATASVARVCGARFTLANTPAWTHSALFDLALFAQNDSLALAIHAQLGGEISSMDLFLRYGRLAAAQTLAAQVDARGPSAYALQLQLRGQLRAMYARRNPNLAWSPLAHEDSLAIQQGLRRGPGEKGYDAVKEGYRDLMRHAILLHDTTTMVALARTAQRDLGQFTLPEQTAEDHYSNSSRDIGEWSTMSQDTVISRLSPLWYVNIRYGVRPPAPRLVADFWWPASGVTRDTVAPIIPVVGKVNLICGGGRPTDEGLHMHNRDMENAWKQAAHLRQWLAQYSAAGLTVTLVRGTEIQSPNFMAYELDRDNKRIVVDSADAAGFWQWYDQTYHAVPVTEAVKLIHTTAWLPPPDGRRLTVSEGVPNGYVDLLAMFSGYAGMVKGETDVCTLVGRDGMILYRHGDVDDGWNGWEEVLQWLFTSPSASGAPHA